MLESDDMLGNIYVYVGNRGMLGDICVYWESEGTLESYGIYLEARVCWEARVSWVCLL